MGPEVPEELAYLWTWFLELSSSRQYAQHGAQAIGYGDMHCWGQLTGRRPRPWEVDLLRELDIVWLSKPARAAEEASDGV